jgi:predicted transporter
LIGFIEFILNNIVLPIGATVAVFFLVFAGFLFVTARGDEERLRLAKKTFLWTSVGIAVLLGSVAIANGIQATVCQIAPGTPGCQ